MKKQEALEVMNEMVANFAKINGPEVGAVFEVIVALMLSHAGLMRITAMNALSATLLQANQVDDRYAALKPSPPEDLQAISEDYQHIVSKAIILLTRGWAPNLMREADRLYVTLFNTVSKVTYD